MDKEANLSDEPPEEIPTIDAKFPTINIANAGKKPGKGIVNLSKNLVANPVALSPDNSPVISPPSSAFVSALQSPYISPRATIFTNLNTNSNPIPSQESPTPANTFTHPSPPVSYCGSQSDDIPSTSYTPPSEKYDYSDDPTNTKFKILTCVPVTGPDNNSRISFSFPVPRNSSAKGSISHTSNAKLRSCDVYIGFHSHDPNLIRFCKWLKSELEVQGIACFVTNRAKYEENQSHEIADRVICSVTFGVVVVTSFSLLNHFSLEEIRFFAQKKNLIPLFFDTDADEIASLFNPHSENKERKEALDGLVRSREFKLEANEGNWRSCISKAAGILGAKLGRKSVAKKEVERFEELPFPRNKYFVGREKEIMEIETAFFGCGDCLEQEYPMPTVTGGTSRQSEGLTDVESEGDTVRAGNYISLEVERSKSGNYKSFGSSVVCINGTPGVGKSELALEYAYRYSQRYAMVLWVGGEAQYFRQNILNISLCMGLDVTADAEKERGRIRSFDEQESEAFKRVKRELFRDMPYLLIIDNLETEREWWEGKDLHDLIPRNTGGTHVIVTTKLARVMNFDCLQLQPLRVSDAMTLIRGRRQREYPAAELDYLRKFNEKLGGSCFGLWVTGSLLSELAITPSALFEAVNQVQYEEHACCSSLSIGDQQFCRTSPFLMKVLSFSAASLQQTNGIRNLHASKMLQVGAWFAPAPIPANLLASAANNIPSTRNRLRKLTKCLERTFCYCSGCLASQTWKSEEDSALLLVNLGLARKANRQPGCWIQFHPITQIFAKREDGLIAVNATVQGIMKIGNAMANSDHLWASVFLVLGSKAEPPLVQLKAMDIVLFIKKMAIPLAIRSFTTFSRCNSALELLKVCTNTLEEVENSFMPQIQDRYQSSLCCEKGTAIEPNSGRMRVARSDIAESYIAEDQSEVATEWWPFRQWRRAVQNLHQYQDSDARPQTCSNIRCTRIISQVGTHTEQNMILYLEIIGQLCTQ
ncbi:P-loop containing nucleoside triphosphate hydrolase superfamily protein [Abeliophyllum distichum]|uniref:P-loop containing nucleoside triphosphate hydrolase superfamily protein n=1 Tax=Abeliophyllum distichum TaxID=126358 RepID=A0ABD1QI72_9LAMI